MTDDDREAARRLAAQAHTVSRASGREPWRDILRWLSRGRYGRRHVWPRVPQLGTPWHSLRSVILLCSVA
jgi:hypothetical protein